MTQFLPTANYSTMGFSLLDPIGKLPLVFFDTETTGVSPLRGDRVIEVGLVRVENGQIAAEYQRLVHPGRYVSPFISQMTGITPAMLADQPPFESLVDELAPLLRGAVLLGHNVHFDLRFLSHEFAAAGRPLDEIVTRDVFIMDTLKIARRRFGRGGNSLGKLAHRLGVTPTGAHRALADAHTTRGVFGRLLEPVGGGECSLCDALMQQGGPMRLLKMG